MYDGKGEIETSKQSDLSSLPPRKTAIFIDRCDAKGEAIEGMDLYSKSVVPTET